MYMFVPHSEADGADEAVNPGGRGQMTGVWEAFPNCCDTPSHRGASDTDRSTWSAAVDVSAAGCETQRDATTEEIHHLIGGAAAELYPEIWGTTSASTAGAAILALNGDCGWGHSGDYTDPGADRIGQDCANYASIDDALSGWCVQRLCGAMRWVIMN